MKKNAFWTFCFSFIPGAGQMYQGYMKRGLSILILFSIFTGLAGVLGIQILLIPVPIIVAYSFFDTFNIRSKFGSEQQIEDDYIWKEFNIDIFNGSLQKRNLLIGITLLLIGIYIVINNVLRDMAISYDIRWLYTILRTITEYLPPILIAGISIGVGMKFLMNPKK